MFKLWDSKYFDKISNDLFNRKITVEDIERGLPEQYSECVAIRNLINAWYDSITEGLEVFVKEMCDGYSVVKDSILFYEKGSNWERNLMLEFVLTDGKQELEFCTSEIYLKIYKRNDFKNEYTELCKMLQIFYDINKSVMHNFIEYMERFREPNNQSYRNIAGESCIEQYNICEKPYPDLSCRKFLDRNELKDKYEIYVEKLVEGKSFSRFIFSEKSAQSYFSRMQICYSYLKSDSVNEELFTNVFNSPENVIKITDISCDLKGNDFDEYSILKYCIDTFEKRMKTSKTKSTIFVTTNKFKGDLGYEELLKTLGFSKFEFKDSSQSLYYKNLEVRNGRKK